MSTENPHFMTPEEADADTNDLASFASQRAKELGYGTEDTTESQETKPEEQDSTVEEKEEGEPTEKPAEEQESSESQPPPTLTKRELRVIQEKKALDQARKELEREKAEFETNSKETLEKLKNVERTEKEVLLDPIGYLRSLGFDKWDQLVREGYEEYLGEDASPNYQVKKRQRQYETEVEKRLREAEERAKAAEESAKQMKLQAEYEKYVGNLRSEVNNLDQSLFENVTKQVEAHGTDYVQANLVKIADWYADTHKMLITPKQALQVYEKELEKLVGPLKAKPKEENNSPENPVVDDTPGTVSNSIGSTRSSKTITDDYDLSEIRKRAAQALYGE